MTALLLFAGVTVFVSSMCSFFEATLYSTRVGALEAERSQGTHSRLAERFLAMKSNIAKPTSAILVLNTVANTAGATICGMYAAQFMTPRGVVAFSIVLTLMILFIGEILPKTYGATHWQHAWWLIVWPLTAMQIGLAPVIRITQSFAHLFSSRRGAPAVTEEEIVANIRLGRTSGQLSESEHELLSAVFHFDDMLVRQVMVPRAEVVILDLAWPIEQSLEVARKTRHTRFPLCRGTLDEAVGIVHIKDLLGIDRAEMRDLTSIARPLRVTPETRPISELLREMQRSQQHMELVYDEHGSVVGMVTMENIVEQLIGTVQDEFDNEWPDILREGQGVYRVRGDVPIEKLNRDLTLVLPSDDADTLSGLLVHSLDRLPKVGDVIPLDSVTAHVLSVGRGRATAVRLVTRLSETPE